ncbi:MAG: ABC transporter permease [Trueperaceae bacterium]|nr:MAG: ABC transporter permease [Trueperaceae bacterium]
MFRFALTQTVSVTITMFVVLSLVFVAMRALPGDAAAILGGLDTEQAQVEAIRRDLGLDRPLLAQYGAYWGQLLRGDLGSSIRERRPVTSVIMDRLPVTLSLAAFAFTLSLAVGIGLGMLAGRTRGSAADGTALGFTTVGLALPEFWLGFLLILLFAVQLGAFPVIGYPVEGDIGVRLWHLTLPAVTLAIPRAAQIARLTRARVLEAMAAEYVRTARSKGVAPRGVTRHVAANALPGLLPLLALELGGLITGTIVVEQVFGLPGLGLTLLGSIGARDYPVVQGVTILAVTVYILVNWLADLLQLVSDPRLRYE